MEKNATMSRSTWSTQLPWNSPSMRCHKATWHTKPSMHYSRS